MHDQLVPHAFGADETEVLTAKLKDKEPPAKIHEPYRCARYCGAKASPTSRPSLEAGAGQR